MTNENGNDNPQNNDNLNELLDIKVEELDEIALREKLTEIIPKYKETHQSNKQLFERAKSAEGGLKELKEKLKTFEDKPTEPHKVAPDAKTGELTDAVLDFFELKGYNDPEQIKVFESVMKKTGMSHREVLKDEYALAKVEAIKKQKEVLAATPSSQRRSGGVSNDLDYWKAKYEQDNSLPDDFALRSAVINAKVEATNSNKPAWHK